LPVQECHAYDEIADRTEPVAVVLVREIEKPGCFNDAGDAIKFNEIDAPLLLTNDINVRAPRSSSAPERKTFIENQGRSPMIRDRIFRLVFPANNAHCGVFRSLLSIHSSIEGYDSTFQGLELRRLGDMDATRLGKEIAR
jgi:hypothetical protein